MQGSHRLPESSIEWLPVLGAALVAILLAELVFRVGERVLRRALHHSKAALTVLQAARNPAHAALPLFAVNLVWQDVPEALPGLGTVQRLTTLLLIGALTWLALGIVSGFARAVVESHPVTLADNLEARRIQTQTRVLSRTVSGLVLVVGASLALITFPAVRQIGTSLLASAGLVGIVAGLPRGRCSAT